jgi:hypothetical protein
MTSRILVAAALLCLVNTAGAVRVLEQLEKPVELTVSQITLPTGETGTLSFKECDECRTSSHRVTSATKYLLNGREVPLADFLIVIEEIRSNRRVAETTNAAVFLDIATERVTRVSVKRAARN